MRILVLAVSATLLMLPASAKVSAQGLAQAATADLSAQTKEAAQKVVKKKAAKAKKEKAEYMRAAPMK